MTSFDLDLTKYQLGWSDEVEYAFAPAKGINAGVVEQISWWKGEPRWMTQHAAAQPAPVRSQADGRVVRREHARHRLPGHLLLPQAVRRAGRRVGRPARADEGDVREAGHPRGRAPVPRRRHRPVRVRGRLPPQPRRPGQAGDPVLRHGHRPARVPRPGQAVLRHRHPARGQQVRRPQHVGVVGRLVHLRPARRRVRDAAAGLLPDQLRERRPVRAHADHRRRGLPGALHRGLLGARSTPATRCTRRSSRSSSSPAPGSPTRRSRTGARTSTTSSPSGPGSRPRATWSGSTATSARS